KMNQDSRRKLKQVYHLYQFIEPLLTEALATRPDVQLVDHGAGKSYLGFILYDLFFKTQASAGKIYGVETRDELVATSRRLADKLGFSAGMRFYNLTVAESITSERLPEHIDIVTALHACNTATDDAIRFALEKRARHIVLVPCCQAEVAAVMRKNKQQSLKNSITELWRHPIHTREFGSHATNVLRCLQLESHGYQVSVTELVGWEHSMKNELIIATYKDLPRRRPAERLAELLDTLGLTELKSRFFDGDSAAA
ncbi:MAG TPA: SAM-dependent methyltransferase, partial [Denitromonas sp.]|nr:SAM-dependent methyltransferase [Denitromonas sp.]